MGCARRFLRPVRIPSSATSALTGPPGEGRPHWFMPQAAWAAAGRAQRRAAPAGAPRAARPSPDAPARAVPGAGPRTGAGTSHLLSCREQPDLRHRPRNRRAIHATSACSPRRRRALRLHQTAQHIAAATLRGSRRPLPPSGIRILACRLNDVRVKYARLDSMERRPPAHDGARPLSYGRSWKSLRQESNLRFIRTKGACCP